MTTLPGSLCCLVLCSHGRGGTILVGSSSDEHVSRPTFAPHVEPEYGGPSPKLVDLQQQPLPSQGRKCVLLEFSGGLTAKTDLLFEGVAGDLLVAGFCAKVSV